MPLVEVPEHPHSVLGVGIGPKVLQHGQRIGQGLQGQGSTGLGQGRQGEVPAQHLGDHPRRKLHLQGGEALEQGIAGLKLRQQGQQGQHIADEAQIDHRQQGPEQAFCGGSPRQGRAARQVGAQLVEAPLQLPAGKG